jgi:DNA end-binding protein Ku
MVSDFEPEKYEDEYRRDLMKLIQRKVKAGELNRVPEAGESKAKPAPAPKQVDLAELLAQSVASAKSPRAANDHRHSHKAKSRARKAVKAEPRHRKSA